MATTTSKPVTLYMANALTAPTLPTDGGDISQLWLPRLGGGPDRLVVLISADALTVVTDLRAWIYQDATWRRLAVAGSGDVLFTTLTIDAIIQFEIQKIGRAERLAFDGTLDLANNVTFQAMRGSDS